MAGVSSHLLVILLGFSHLIISLNAVPITRTRNLLHDTQGILAADNTHQKPVVTEERLEGEAINERMDLERDDYPGIGANNRHTPKPPLGRMTYEIFSLGGD